MRFIRRGTGPGQQESSEERKEMAGTGMRTRVAAFGGDSDRAHVAVAHLLQQGEEYAEATAEVERMLATSSNGYLPGEEPPPPRCVNCRAELPGHTEACGLYRPASTLRLCPAGVTIDHGPSDGVPDEPVPEIGEKCRAEEVPVGHWLRHCDGTYQNRGMRPTPWPWVLLGGPDGMLDIVARAPVTYLGPERPGCDPGESGSEPDGCPVIGEVCRAEQVPVKRRANR